MFELTVRRSFSAAHAIVMRGVRERVHGHNWMVTLVVTGGALDPDGLLCDFHALEGTLDDAVSPFHNRSLNEMPPFDRVNPTAENVAEFVALEVSRRLPRGVTVQRVDIEEAPGCVASFVTGAAPGIEVLPLRGVASTAPDESAELEESEGGAPTKAAGSRRK